MIGNALKLSRHTGRDCRYPDHRDVKRWPSLASGFRQSLPERRVLALGRGEV